MPLIVATTQPIYGRVLVQINWADKPAVTFASVYRHLADGSATPVRITVSTNTTGEEMELSAGMALMYDTEAPLDEAIYYTTQSTMDTSTATTASNVLASDGFWLKDPLRPWADQRVVLEVPQEPDCVPESAIFFQGMDIESRPSRSGVFGVNQARLPILAARTRGSITSSLILVSRNFNDRDALITLNETGGALLWQGPAAYGMPDRYMAVNSDYSVSRLSPDHRVPWRIHVMPHTEVGRPAGLAEGVLGVRWVDTCDVYTTFGDMTAANVTTTQVLLGAASLNPDVVTGLRTYAQVNSEFASYTLVAAGSRTYEQLLEGA